MPLPLSISGQSYLILLHNGKFTLALSALHTPADSHMVTPRELLLGGKSRSVMSASSNLLAIALYDRMNKIKKNEIHAITH